MLIIPISIFSNYPNYFSITIPYATHILIIYHYPKLPTTNITNIYQLSLSSYYWTSLPSYQNYTFHPYPCSYYPNNVYVCTWKLLSLSTNYPTNILITPTIPVTPILFLPILSIVTTIHIPQENYYPYPHSSFIPIILYISFHDNIHPIPISY